MEMVLSLGPIFFLYSAKFQQIYLQTITSSLKTSSLFSEKGKTL